MAERVHEVEMARHMESSAYSRLTPILAVQRTEFGSPSGRVGPLTPKPITSPYLAWPGGRPRLNDHRRSPGGNGASGGGDGKRLSPLQSESKTAGGATKLQQRDEKGSREEAGKRANLLQVQLESLKVQLHTAEKQLEENERKARLQQQQLSKSKVDLEHYLHLQKSKTWAAEGRAQVAEMEVMRLKEALRERAQKIVATHDIIRENRELRSRLKAKESATGNMQSPETDLHNHIAWHSHEQKAWNTREVKYCQEIAELKKRIQLLDTALVSNAFTDKDVNCKSEAEVQTANANFLKANEGGHPGFRAVFGDYLDFAGGLDHFSGRPIVMMSNVPTYDWENKLELEMQHELCECTDLEIYRLRTSNYGHIESDLATEWEYVVHPDPDRIYPGQAGYTVDGTFTDVGQYQKGGGIDRLGRRRPQPLEKFLNHTMAKTAKLTRPETIMIIFYTGPGFMALNGALRERRFQFGKLSCWRCLKGRHTITTEKTSWTPCTDICGNCKRCKVHHSGWIVDGRSPCADVCGKCTRCSTDLSGWSCKVSRKGSLKVVEYHAPKGKFADAVLTSFSEAEKFVEKYPSAGITCEAFDFSQSETCPNCIQGKDCFSTCIAVLNSALHKLTQVTPLVKDAILYRGLSCLSFEDDLLRLDVEQPKGFVECGCSSATPDRSVAVSYSGGRCEGIHCPHWIGPEDGGYCGRHKSTVLEIKTGQIDRGADVSWASQFPGEKEHTLMPLTNFQVTGMRRDKNLHMNIVETKINLNMKAKTLDDLKNGRQNICLEFGEELLREARQLLSSNEVICRDTFEADCRRFMDKIRFPLEHARFVAGVTSNADYFNDTRRFRETLNEMFSDWRRMMSNAAVQLQRHAEAFLSVPGQWSLTLKSARQAKIILERIFENDSLPASSTISVVTLEEERKCLLKSYELMSFVMNRSYYSNDPSDKSTDYSAFAAMSMEKGRMLARIGGQENLEAALASYDCALRILEDMSELDKNPRIIQQILTYKGKLMLAMGRELEACDCFKGADAAIDEQLKTNDDTLLSANTAGNMGLAYERMNMLREASQKFLDSLAQKVSVLGAGHSEVDASLCQVRAFFKLSCGLNNDLRVPVRVFEILSGIEIDDKKSVRTLTGAMLDRALHQPPALYEWGCSALLAQMMDDIQVFLLDLDVAINAVCRAIECFPEHKGISREACAALEKFVQNAGVPGFLLERILSSIWTVLNAHKIETDVQLAGLRVIQHIPNAVVAEKSLDEGGVSILLCGLGDQQTAHLSLSILETLLRSSHAERTSSLIAFLDGKAIIQRAMDDHHHGHENVQNLGKSCLEMCDPSFEMVSKRRHELGQRAEEATRRLVEEVPLVVKDRLLARAKVVMARKRLDEKDITGAKAARAEAAQLYQKAGQNAVKELLGLDQKIYQQEYVSAGLAALSEARQNLSAHNIAGAQEARMQAAEDFNKARQCAKEKLSELDNEIRIEVQKQEEADRDERLRKEKEAEREEAARRQRLSDAQNSARVAKKEASQRKQEVDDLISKGDLNGALTSVGEAAVLYEKAGMDDVMELKSQNDRIKVLRDSILEKAGQHKRDSDDLIEGGDLHGAISAMDSAAKLYEEAGMHNRAQTELKSQNEKFEAFKMILQDKRIAEEKRRKDSDDAKKARQDKAQRREALDQCVERKVLLGPHSLESRKAGKTALHRAAYAGELDVILLLLKAGAEVDSGDDNDQKTGLHFACDQGHSEVVQTLLEHGADIAAQTSPFRETMLHLASRAGRHEVVQILLEHGADVSVKDMRNFTSLHMAAAGGNPAVVRALLEHGADADAKDAEGKTPSERTQDKETKAVFAQPTGLKKRK